MLNLTILSRWNNLSKKSINFHLNFKKESTINVLCCSFLVNIQEHFWQKYLMGQPVLSNRRNMHWNIWLNAFNAWCIFFTHTKIDFLCCYKFSKFSTFSYNVVNIEHTDMTINTRNLFLRAMFIHSGTSHSIIWFMGFIKKTTTTKIWLFTRKCLWTIYQ